MAEINNNQKKIIGSKKINKTNTTVDLTPMVDLGFLLITFFIFTTSMMEPKVLDMMEPDDKAPLKDPLCQSCVLTIILADSNAIFYYQGNETLREMKLTDFSVVGIRKILMEKKIKVMAARGKNEFSVIVKPTERSRLQNLVNIQDEATLVAVARFYLAEPTVEEISAVDKWYLSLQHD
ncbi:MAG: biopolymer transporter ExbD [Ferruginibacter sp.]